MFDVVRVAMNRAADSFGNGNQFNAAGFSQAMVDLAGLTTQIDGRLVETILCGRGDVRQLDGGSHYEIISEGV